VLKILDMVPIHALILQAIFSATKEDSTQPVQQQHVQSPPQRKIIPKNQKRPSKTRTVKKRRGVYENRDTHI
jgi:hypothetical protein